MKEKSCCGEVCERLRPRGVKVKGNGGGVGMATYDGINFFPETFFASDEAVIRDESLEIVQQEQFEEEEEG